MAVKKSELAVNALAMVAAVVKEVDAFLTSNYRGVPLHFSSKSWWALSKDQREMVVAEYRQAGWDARVVTGEQRDDAEYLQLS